MNLPPTSRTPLVFQSLGLVTPGETLEMSKHLAYDFGPPFVLVLERSSARALELVELKIGNYELLCGETAPGDAFLEARDLLDVMRDRGHGDFFRSGHPWAFDHERISLAVRNRSASAVLVKAVLFGTARELA